MRVISGKAKGRKLKRVPGDGTRPIMDRVKENLFNVLSDSVRGTRWLDLFAGTGQVGIEALSRGASEVVFVDNVRAAVNTIRQNLDLTGLQVGSRVLMKDAYQFLKSPTGAPFDVIYIAPPQYKGMWHTALKVIDAEPDDFLALNGLAIVQIDPSEYEEVDLHSLLEYDRRRYGSTLLCFYELPDNVT